MTKRGASYHEILPHLFRVEFAKMTAVLCRYFGLKHIAVAEDIVSETFLKATELWGEKGIPENPAAWLYTVAKNKTKDYLKRWMVFEKQIKPAIKGEEWEQAPDFDFTPQTITDSQLAMIFVVCNPSIGKDAQICLALQLLCGFSVAEVAAAFLTKTETIKKRLLRAKTILRNDHFQIKQLEEAAIRSRLDTVLRTLYLLFNEGYYSTSSNHLIRKDLCSEAMRLTLLLTAHPLTNTGPSNALLALMCYQSSRFEARENEEGEVILFEQQNKELWSKELIEKGNYYLVNACSGEEISKYHLEAGIAYWHTTPTDQHKWEYILQLYNQLILIEYSPMTALNRTFAFAKVYGHTRAIPEAEKLHLTENSHYYALLAYLYTATDQGKAIGYYNTAIALTRSVTAQHTLKKAVERLRNG
jgi:RNA polymerase sigma factor (sigma-70 family)